MCDCLIVGLYCSPSNRHACVSDAMHTHEPNELIIIIISEQWSTTLRRYRTSSMIHRISVLGHLNRIKSTFRFYYPRQFIILSVSIRSNKYSFGPNTRARTAATHQPRQSESERSRSAVRCPHTHTHKWPLCGICIAYGGVGDAILSAQLFQLSITGGVESTLWTAVLKKTHTNA